MQSTESTIIIDTALYVHPSQTCDMECTAEARQYYIVIDIFLLYISSNRASVKYPHSTTYPGARVRSSVSTSQPTAYLGLRIAT